MKPVPALRHGRWRRFAAALLNAAAIFGFLTLVPSERYGPGCGRWQDAHVLRGPLREEFVILVTEAMRREGFRHWRLGTTILVPAWPIFDGTPAYPDPLDFELNATHKIATSIAHGTLIRGRSTPPPEPVQRMLQEINARYGPFPRLAPDGSRIFGPSLNIADDCNLFRAAVLRVEEMPQPLPDLEAQRRRRGYRPPWEPPAGPVMEARTSTP